MNLESQLIFFFSALGGFNGLLLAGYFALKARRGDYASCFLALLVLMLSIRTIKSVFFFFNPQLAGGFIQAGLSALILIGPFLYLYLKSSVKKARVKWWFHVIPLLLGISILGWYYPYVEHRQVWSQHLVGWINNIWFLYIAFSFPFILPSLRKVFSKQKVLSIDIWYISVFAGVLMVWCAYKFGTYTSYIVGALTFSFVLYLIVLLLIFNNSKKSPFYQKREKYQNKTISEHRAKQIMRGLTTLEEQKLYLNPKLTMDDVARGAGLTKHELSQYLNEQLGKSFSTFISEFRVHKAQELLTQENNLSVEGIGYECGFNSKSTFFSTFKKQTGHTPAQYRKNKGF